MWKWSNLNRKHHEALQPGCWSASNTCRANLILKSGTHRYSTILGVKRMMQYATRRAAYHFAVHATRRPCALQLTPRSGRASNLRRTALFPFSLFFSRILTCLTSTIQSNFYNILDCVLISLHLVESCWIRRHPVPTNFCQRLWN